MPQIVSPKSPDAIKRYRARTDRNARIWASLDFRAIFSDRPTPDEAAQDALNAAAVAIVRASIRAQLDDGEVSL
jgi:hypothetical protein